MTDLEALVTINACRAVTLEAYQELLARLGSPTAILRASKKTLGAMGLVSASVIERILKTAREFDAKKEIERAQRGGVELVPYDSGSYPANLKNIPNPPLLLYLKGNIVPADRVAIAMVGSRRCSHYGRTHAERLATELASCGFCIVSGLAYGIDAAAHRGAMKARGRTIAVQGCGLGRVYPARHKELATEITQHGAVLSELPLDAPPAARNFPGRNRIISGLSLGVTVVEAAKRSGSLITATWAAEQGREVFALPGSLDNPASQGTNALIRDGAKLVQSAQEIITELGPLAEGIQLPDGRKMDDLRGLSLVGDEGAVFSFLGPNPVSIDEIVQETGLVAGAVNSALLTLEIKGLTRRLAGNRFTRV
ncbi:MAG: DNA-protecting protein DprA [Planctomycetes bacterium]|nr:DNA-protecting protein DprA [Planctomycetota bacterium]